MGNEEIRGFRCSENLEIFKFSFQLHEPLFIKRDEFKEPMLFQPIFFGEPVANNIIKEFSDQKDETSQQDYGFHSLGVFCTNTLKSISWQYPSKKEMKFISVRIRRNHFDSFISRSEKLAKTFDPSETYFIFEEFDHIMRLMYLRIFEMDQDDIFYEEQMHLYASNLFLTFLKNINKREVTVESNKYPFNIEPVFKTRKVLLSILNKPVSIDYLAEECGLSESRLRFLFKKVFGTTIHQYHQDIRLNKSREFLQKGKLTMSMIAMEMGFSSSSHFSIAYKKKFNVTPKEYKNDKNLWNQ